MMAAGCAPTAAILVDLGDEPIERLGGRERVVLARPVRGGIQRGDRLVKRC
jgi:hypothetical protein